MYDNRHLAIVAPSSIYFWAKSTSVIPFTSGMTCILRCFREAFLVERQCYQYGEFAPFRARASRLARAPRIKLHPTPRCRQRIGRIKVAHRLTDFVFDAPEQSDKRLPILRKVEWPKYRVYRGRSNKWPRTTSVNRFAFFQRSYPRLRSFDAHNWQIRKAEVYVV